jgi:hypothetical protein
MASELMKQLRDQISEPRQSPREARPAQHRRHHPGRVKEAASVGEVTAKVEHCTNGSRDDFRIGKLRTGVFTVLHGLEQIVHKTVYCQRVIAHFVFSFDSCIATKS